MSRIAGRQYGHVTRGSCWNSACRPRTIAALDQERPTGPRPCRRLRRRPRPAQPPGPRHGGRPCLRRPGRPQPRLRRRPLGRSRNLATHSRGHLRTREAPARHPHAPHPDPRHQGRPPPPQHPRHQPLPHHPRHRGAAHGRPARPRRQRTPPRRPPRRHRARSGCSTASRRVKALVDPDQSPTRSPPEDFFLAFCTKYGLPVSPGSTSPCSATRSTPSSKRSGSSSRSTAGGSTRTISSFESDRERDATAIEYGFATFRVTQTRLTRDPAREAERLQRALARRRRENGAS